MAMKDGAMPRKDWDGNLKIWEKDKANPRIDSELVDEIQAYAISRQRPGTFIMAVLCNDLVLAMATAKPAMFNRHRGALTLKPDEKETAIQSVVRFMRAVLPALLRGDERRVRMWLHGETNYGDPFTSGMG